MCGKVIFYMFPAIKVYLPLTTVITRVEIEMKTAMMVKLKWMQEEHVGFIFVSKGCCSYLNYLVLFFTRK